MGSINDYFLFNPNKNSLGDIMLFNIPRHEALMRLLVLSLFVFYGIISGIFRYKQLDSKAQLQKQHEELTQIYEELAASEEELRIQNEELQSQSAELNANKKELENQKSFFEQLFLQSATSTQILSRDGWCLKINRKLSEIFGVLPEDMEGEKYNIFKDVEIIKKGVINHLEKVFKNHETVTWEVYFDIESASKSQNISINENKKAWFSCKSYPIMDGDGNLAFVVVQHEDITQKKAREEKIIQLSYHDKLTGLHNRASFEEELKRHDEAEHLPISILIGDVNGLKLTNDVFGHQEGDRLLQKIAEIMKEVCSEKHLISRWGGDEFAIIMPFTTARDANEICQKIRQSCITSNMDPIQPSLSLGTSTKDTSEKNIIAVLKEAEDRMYRHKLLESRSVRNSIIASLEKTLFERSFETEEHAHRLSEKALEIGKAIGLSQSQQDDLRLLSLLHDIGKIAISDSILTKPGALTPPEWDEMKKHPEIGYRIAQSTQELSHIADNILSHHERWDGTGYPQGLKSYEIPKLSRIISIVDAYDVMTHGRPYKNAVPHSEALEEISRCSGSQFDPEIVEIFLKLS
jgi:PAS domain S-box/diguanylate cyclase (GGDEF) domain